jgi:hypothetical protein
MGIGAVSRCVTVVGALALACGDSGAADDGGSSGSGTTTSTTSTTSTESTGLGTSSSETAAVDSSSTGEPLQLCGIEDLAPGTASPIVASDTRPMQLPTEITTILERSCGCHYADDLVIAGDYPSGGMLDITTWPAWQSTFNNGPTYEAVRKKLEPSNPILIMPPLTCNVGGGETMLPEDRARLLEWIAADAPDGVTWSAT